MQSNIERIRTYAARNGLRYLDVLEAIVCRAVLTEQVLEAARREIRERDKFAIEERRPRW